VEDIISKRKYVYGAFLSPDEEDKAYEEVSKSLESKTSETESNPTTNAEVTEAEMTTEEKDKITEATEKEETIKKDNPANKSKDSGDGKIVLYEKSFHRYNVSRTVKKGEKVKVKYIVVNNTKDTLLIGDIKIDCESSSFTKTPILPGKTGLITYTTTKIQLFYKRTMTITFDFDYNASNYLKTLGSVIEVTTTLKPE